jgi:hypothetical protein
MDHYALSVSCSTARSFDSATLHARSTLTLNPLSMNLVSWNLWTEAWLAALALSLDYEITTFDRGFKSFRELKLRLLEMPDR